MATKIEGICKGFKFISQIFVVKEREIEIGSPTDVKHVSHIGWDHQSGRAPSWMNEFKTGPGFSSASIGNSCSGALSPWSSQDFSESTRKQEQPDVFNDKTPIDLPNIPKKQRSKKSKCNSSSRSKARPKSKLAEENPEIIRCRGLRTTMCIE